MLARRRASRSLMSRRCCAPRASSSICFWRRRTSSRAASRSARIRSDSRCARSSASASSRVYAAAFAARVAVCAACRIFITTSECATTWRSTASMVLTSSSSAPPPPPLSSAAPAPPALPAPLAPPVPLAARSASIRRPIACRTHSRSTEASCTAAALDARPRPCAWTALRSAQSERKRTMKRGARPRPEEGAASISAATAAGSSSALAAALLPPPPGGSCTAGAAARWRARKPVKSLKFVAEFEAPPASSASTLNGSTRGSGAGGACDLACGSAETQRQLRSERRMSNTDLSSTKTTRWCMLPGR